MGFKEAVRTCLNKYATFSGRASRSEYWYFSLFVTLVAVILGGMGALLLGPDPDNPSAASLVLFIGVGVFYLAMFLPLIGVGVRRLHDRNMSGWWFLGFLVLGSIPFVGFLFSIAWFVISVLKGTDGDNRFGPDPLQIQNRAAVFA